jgi:hypothetical protein
MNQTKAGGDSLVMRLRPSENGSVYSASVCGNQMHASGTVSAASALTSGSFESLHLNLASLLFRNRRSARE